MSRHNLTQGPVAKESAKTEAQRLALDTRGVLRVITLNTVGDLI
jgi:hypothetical protein